MKTRMIGLLQLCALASFVALVIIFAQITGCAGHKRSQSDQIAERLQSVRDEVSRVVSDEDRRKKLQAAIDHFAAELKSFNGSASDLTRSLRTLNADPDASRAQFDELIERYEAERTSSRARLTQIHLELLSLTTEEEWHSISKREDEVLKADDPARLQEAK